MDPYGAPPGMPPESGMTPFAEEAPPILAGEPMTLPGPLYPARFLKEDGTPNPPKKPTATAARDKALRDQRHYARLRERFMKDLRRYRQLHKGVFEDHDPTVDVGFVSTEASTQVNKVCNMGAGIPFLYEIPHTTAAERSASQLLEDFCDHFMTAWGDFHATSYGTSLKWELFFYSLVYGHLIGRCFCDLEDPDFPWKPALLDPATTFPEFGDEKEGLRCVTRVYETTYGKVLDVYRPSRKVEKQLLAKQREDEDGIADVDRERSGTVIEYCDVWYHGVWLDEVEVKYVAHEYGYVPYTARRAPGEPGGLATRDRVEKPSLREYRAGYRRGDLGGEWDLVEKGPSFFRYVEQAILQREALLGELFTQVKQATNPATVVTSPYDEPPEPFDFGPGGNNTLRPGENLQPIPTSPRPTDVGPILQQTASEIVKGWLPDQVFGDQEGSNVSGFAVESLIAAAKDRIQPYLEMVEGFTSDILGLALREFRDFGHLATADGRYVVPRQGHGGGFGGDMAGGIVDQLPPEAHMMLAQAGIMPLDDAPEATLTREAITLVGTRVKVRLYSVALQNMTQMMNVASMALNQPVPVWSWEHAQEWLGTRNPDRMWQQIVVNKALMDPNVMQLVVIPQALWRSGNKVAYQSYMRRIVAPMLMQAQQQMMSPVMNGGAPGGALPSGQQPQALPAGVPGPQTAQGDSMAQLQPPQGVPGAPGGGGPTDFSPV